jgi:acyl-CoA thioesterase FadM
MLDRVRALPCILTRTIPAEFIDGNGHMNMARYTEIGNEGLLGFFRGIGVDIRVLRSQGFSVVAARQALTYRHELLAGERVAVHAGLHDFDADRLHYFLYTVSLDHDRIACTDERLGVCLDMARRRSASFPGDVARHLEDARLAHQGTGWVPELSGAIRIRAGAAGRTADPAT